MLKIVIYLINTNSYWHGGGVKPKQGWCTENMEMCFMSDVVVPQLSRENSKTSESASYANVLLIGMKNTHIEYGHVAKRVDHGPWCCNMVQRVTENLISARVTFSYIESSWKELRHALTLLKPSVFSWLKLLIKVMDCILFLCAGFFSAAFNLFYNSNGFQWWWKKIYVEEMEKSEHLIFPTCFRLHLTPPGMKLHHHYPLNHFTSRAYTHTHQIRCWWWLNMKM